MKLSRVSWLLCVLAAVLVSARSGKITLSQPDDFQAGKFKAAALSSTGKVISGKDVKTIKVDTGVVWSVLETGPDEVLLGTGNDAKLLKYANGKFEQVFQDQEKGRLAVNQIAREGNAIYFSVIPKPAIYKMEGKDIKKLAEIDSKFIFALKPLPNGSVLAAGGPKASVFLVKPDGKVEKILSLDAEQVMTIIDAGNGEYIAGTSKPGLLISFKLDGTYRVLYSFQQEEVAGVKMLSDKSLIVAVNQGGAPPQGEMGPRPEGMQMSPPPGMQKVGEPGDPDEQMQMEEEPTPQAQSAKPPSGRAAVYRVYSDKGIKQIFALKQGTILSLDGDEKNGFFVGTDDQGRVYQVLPANDEVLLSFDLQSGKVICFGGSNGEVHWIGTAQPAKLVKIEKGGAKSSYTSNVLDAQFQARWGVLDWMGTGAVKFETRSGNVQETDASWSKWQEVETGNPGKVLSPKSRYLQFRANWTGDNVEIDRVAVSYRDVNQAEYIAQLTLGAAPQPGRPPQEAQQSSQKGAKAQDGVFKRLQVNWRIDNPDQDHLYLQIFFKKVNDKIWTLLVKGDEIKGNAFQWDASVMPDGIYQVKLAVSDWPDNPEDEAFATEKISDRFIIDTTKPVLTYKVSEKGVVSGQAQDETSAVSSMQYFVDDKDSRAIISKDGVLDEKVEQFEFSLKDLTNGPHKIFIQACDQVENCTTAAEEFTIK